MKTIDIRPQPRLSLARTLKLTVNGIRYRIFRSIVTMAVITVAIAFLMNNLTESLVKKTIAVKTRERIQSLRQVTTWTARLAAPGTDSEILNDLATATDDAPVLREYATFGQFTQNEIDALREPARNASAYLRYLDSLNFGHRRQLVHNAVGSEVFVRLAQPAGWERFHDALARNHSLVLPTDEATLQQLAADWEQLAAKLQRIREGQQRAIDELQGKLDGATMLDRLATLGVATPNGKSDASDSAASGSASVPFDQVVRAAGFALSPEQATVLGQQARDLADGKALESRFSDVRVKKMVAARLDVLPSEVSSKLLWKFVANKDNAAWFLTELNKLETPEMLRDAGKHPITFDAARAVALAAQHRELESLLAAERLGGDVGGGLLGIGERMTWLLFVSMLVCTVGIANAMLMTVTERFREIATLKCLGALDSFIMLIFVMEASFLGVIGGFFGAILGGVIGTLRMVALYGFQASANIQFGDLAVAGLIALVLGMLLGVVAAIYPSFKAARLAPMEAMRVE